MHEYWTHIWSMLQANLLVEDQFPDLEGLCEMQACSKQDFTSKFGCCPLWRKKGNVVKIQQVHTCAVPWQPAPAVKALSCVKTVNDGSVAAGSVDDLVDTCFGPADWGSAWGVTFCCRPVASVLEMWTSRSAIYKARTNMHGLMGEAKLWSVNVTRSPWSWFSAIMVSLRKIVFLPGAFPPEYRKSILSSAFVTYLCS